MNPAAVLALIADLYGQLQQAGERISQLEAQLAEAQKAPPKVG